MDWEAVYRQLSHWRPDLTVDGWWGLKHPHEKAWGAVLVQNTRWHNAMLAFTRMREAELTAVERLLSVPAKHLEEVIRPCGFYRSKAQALKGLAAWWQTRGRGTNSANGGVEAIREQLLAIRGIGPETADTLLLYVFNRRTFVGDAYARRLYHRLNGGGHVQYEAVRQAVLSTTMTTEQLKLLHAQIVEFGKEICRKKSPRCRLCPLVRSCPSSLTHMA